VRRQTSYQDINHKSNPLSAMRDSDWQIDFHAFSSQEREHHIIHIDGATPHAEFASTDTEGIIVVKIPLPKVFHDDAIQAFNTSNDMAKGARVALADYAARSLSRSFPLNAVVSNTSGGSLTIKTMGQARHFNSSDMKQTRRSKRKMPPKKEVEIPYVLERTDCFISGGLLQFFVHIDATGCGLDEIRDAVPNTLAPTLDQLKTLLTSQECFKHVAVVVLQRQLRSMLQSPCKSTSAEEDNRKYLDAVAFIADGSILPRNSGRSHQPMSSPPAIPFKSPESDMLTRCVQVEVGWWRQFLKEDGSVNDDCVGGSNNNAGNNSTTVSIRGMIIPRGVTLIVGGGYHGKSTLLMALSLGIYDKIPGDGRELCVTHTDALSVRAEDGRYVNNCNVSAFITNLPTGGNTNKFSTKDASGSTSQAANVIEGLECGTTALLVDEDVSAANFMARDGRMRAMIMDEPITPLLYRVNGLYLSKEHNVSTVIVVGGVGEWLDVADAVVLMKDYVAYDGLEKARSVSYQFSYNHVQYGGRGVVHRLPWEVKVDTNAAGANEKELVTLSPLRRKPRVEKFHNVAVHLLDSGSSRLRFYPDTDSSNTTSNDEDDEDNGIADMSKCSQLLGNASEQLYGCGICVLWLLKESANNPGDDILDLLQRLELALDNEGVNGLISSIDKSTVHTPSLPRALSSNTTHDMWEDVGFAYRPRKQEVAMTLTRIRGMQFDILPEKAKPTSVVSEEDEQKKKMAALAELWENRRKK